MSPIHRQMEQEWRRWKSGMKAIAENYKKHVHPANRLHLYQSLLKNTRVTKYLKASTPKSH